MEKTLILLLMRYLYALRDSYILRVYKSCFIYILYILIFNYNNGYGIRHLGILFIFSTCGITSVNYVTERSEVILENFLCILTYIRILFTCFLNGEILHPNA